MDVLGDDFTIFYSLIGIALRILFWLTSITYFYIEIFFLHNNMIVYWYAWKTSKNSIVLPTLLAWTVGLVSQRWFAEGTSYARFDFNAGFLTPSPLYKGNSQTTINQKVVTQDIYNTKFANSAATYTSPDSYIKYDRWANGHSAREGLAYFNIFLYST